MIDHEDPMNRLPREVVGQCQGYTEVQGPIVFLVPIRQIKPANPHKISVPISWRGDRNQTFEIGQWYTLTASNTPIHGWEATTARPSPRLG